MAARGSAAREVLQTLLVALVLALAIRAFVVESFVVDGVSMEPVLHDGERVVPRLAPQAHVVSLGRVVERLAALAAQAVER